MKMPPAKNVVCLRCEKAVATIWNGYGCGYCQPCSELEDQETLEEYAEFCKVYAAFVSAHERYEATKEK